MITNKSWLKIHNRVHVSQVALSEWSVIIRKLFSIGTLGTNFSDILIKNRTFSFKKMRLKMSSARWRLFCPGRWVNDCECVLMYKKIRKLLIAYRYNGLQLYTSNIFLDYLSTHSFISRRTYVLHNIGANVPVKINNTPLSTVSVCNKLIEILIFQINRYCFLCNDVFYLYEYNKYLWI